MTGHGGNDKTFANNQFLVALWRRWQRIITLSQHPFIGELPAAVFRDDEDLDQPPLDG
jgi:hypothetical protein